ncbi:MAG: MFS transporter [Deinococcales bacterium]
MTEGDPLPSAAAPAPTEFWKLWSGQSISLLGSLVSRIVLPFVVIYSLGASADQVAWVRAAEIAPGVAAGLFAGVWVDRWRRRPLMVGADLARGLMLLSLPASYWLGLLSLVQVLVVAAAVSVLSATFGAAYEAYLPGLVGVARLENANSRLGASAAVAEVAGFGLAGFLFQVTGIAALVVDGCSYFLSALSLSSIRHRETVSPRPSAASPVREIREGLHALLSRPLLVRLALAACARALGGGVIGAVYVLYISRGLQVAPGLQGLLYALGGVSAFAGAWLASRVRRRWELGRTLAGTAVAAAAGIALVPLAFGPMGLILAFVTGQQLISDAADTIYEVLETTVRQAAVEGHLLGRVTSAWQVATGSFLLVGTLAGGYLATASGLRVALWTGVGVQAVSAVWVIARLRTVRAVDVDLTT